MKKFRTLASIGLAVVVLFGMTAAYKVPDFSPPTTRTPNSISALGDSITQGYNSCLFTAGPCEENSWATGSQTTSILSHLERLNPDTKIKSWNNAQYGAYMKDLPAQAELASMQKPELVTILAGANDLCAYLPDRMTSPESLKESFGETLRILSTKLPETRIFVASIPNITQMANLNKTNPEAEAIWSTGALCNLLLNQPDETVRSANSKLLEARIEETNAMIQQLCDSTKNCYHDNNAVYNVNMSENDLSTHDYFHPSQSGQAKLGSVIWSSMPLYKMLFKIDSRSIKGDPEKAPKIVVVNPSESKTVTGTIFFEASISTYAEYVQPEKVYLKTPIGSFDLQRVYEKDNKDLTHSTWGLSVDSTLAPNGTEATVTVIAVDNLGNVSESSPITAKVWNPAKKS